MEKSAVLRVSKPITKSVPLKTIQLFEGTNPRQKQNILDERVDLFKELYKTQAEKIPPIELLPIQNGDPKNPIYLILDGLHRYHAAKSISLKEIPANIHTNQCYTLPDLEGKKARTEILMMACPFNATSATPLTKQEMIDAAKTFYDAKYPEDRIAQSLGVCARTIRNWLQEVKRGNDQQLKEEVLEKLKKGVSARQIARELEGEVGRRTIDRLIEKIKEEEGGPKRKDFQNDPPPDNVLKFPKKPKEPDIPPDDDDELLPDPRLTRPNTEITDEMKKQIEKRLFEICDEIRAMPWFEDADDVVLTSLMPILEEKSDTIKKAFDTKGLGTPYFELKAHYKEERRLHHESNRLSVERDDTITKLKVELKRRKEECKYDCEFSKEWLKKEFDISVDYLIENLETLKTALKDSYVPDIKKNQIEIPKEATPAINQLALKSAYVAVTHFEWAQMHTLPTPRLQSNFERYTGLIKTLGYDKRKDLNQRIVKVKEFAYNGGGHHEAE